MGERKSHIHHLAGFIVQLCILQLSGCRVFNLLMEFNYAHIIPSINSGREIF